MEEQTFPRRAFKNETKYRGMNAAAWIDKEQDPWGVTVKAFLRQEKDVDGVTVLPRAHLCCALNIRGIGRIAVGDIESVQNPLNAERLYVEEDTSDHGYIVNVPFHTQFPKEARDIAMDLAGLCSLLAEDEFKEAREQRKTMTAGSTEVHSLD